MNQAIPFSLRLYVAGEGPNSAQALVNLQALCERHLAGRYQLEVIDVLREPQRALVDGVFLTPMVVKVAPGPAHRIAGNLSEPAPLLAILGVAVKP